MGTTGTKICSICKVEKPFSEYHKHKECKNGVRGICKVCRKEQRKGHYWNRSPLERQLEILAISLLSRTSGRIARRQYFDKGIECRIGRNIPEVMNYLRENFADDIQSLLDRGEQVTVDRIDSSKSYEAGNIQIMSHKENSLRGSMAFVKLASHAVLIEDTKTGSIVKAISKTAAARAIGCSFSTVDNCLNRNSSPPIYGRYKITRESE